MGERIIFKDRDSRDDWRRVEFVEGVVTTGEPGTGLVACGPNTEFPMPVTLKQLWEKLFRVKEAEFQSGYLEFTVGAGTEILYAPSSAPAARATKTDSVTYQTRGYVKDGEDDFNDASYDAGDGTYFSEIGSKERGIWRPCWNGTGNDFVDAFKYDSLTPDDFATSSDWFIFGTQGVQASVNLGNRVAIVRADPGDPFDAATNQFFLEIEFLGIVTTAAGDGTCSPDVTSFDCVFDPGYYEFTVFSMVGNLPTSATDYGTGFFTGYGSHTLGAFTCSLNWVSPGHWEMAWTLDAGSGTLLPDGGGSSYEDQCQPNPIEGYEDETATGGGASVYGWRGYYGLLYDDGPIIWIKGDHSVCDSAPGTTFMFSTNAKTGILGDFDAAKVEAGNYKIRLAPGDGTNDATAQLYTNAGSDYVSAEDFIHKATKWWPYATKAAAAAWATATGATANGGPSA